MTCAEYFVRNGDLIKKIKNHVGVLKVLKIHAKLSTNDKIDPGEPRPYFVNGRMLVS